MRESIWRAIAVLANCKVVRDWLVKRADAHPYTDIKSADGSETYMRRGWVFNPYGKDAEGRATAPRWPKLPSIRVHRIMREDVDRHLHDHPWDRARTMIMDGWYDEERPTPTIAHFPPGAHKVYWTPDGARAQFARIAPYTGTLVHGEYHRIIRVPIGGVTTLFWTWNYRSTWGFLVDGVKVPHRDYLK